MKTHPATSPCTQVYQEIYLRSADGWSKAGHERSCAETSAGKKHEDRCYQSRDCRTCIFLGGRGNGFMSSDTGILNRYKNHMLVETRRLSNMYVHVECMQLCHMPFSLQ